MDFFIIPGYSKLHFSISKLFFLHFNWNTENLILLSSHWFWIDVFSWMIYAVHLQEKGNNLGSSSYFFFKIFYFYFISLDCLVLHFIAKIVEKLQGKTDFSNNFKVRTKTTIANTGLFSFFGCSYSHFNIKNNFFSFQLVLFKIDTVFAPVQTMNNYFPFSFSSCKKKSKQFNFAENFISFSKTLTSERLL